MNYAISLIIPSTIYYATPFAVLADYQFRFRCCVGDEIHLNFLHHSQNYIFIQVKHQVFRTMFIGSA